MELYQKKLFTKKHLILNEESLYVEISGPFRGFEIDVPFEDIMVERITRNTKIDWFLLGISCMFGFFFLATFIPKVFFPPTKSDWEIIFILFCLAVVFTFITIKTMKDEYLIPLADNYPIVIFRTVPNKQYVREFASSLNDRVRAYLLNKYIAIPTDVETKERNIYWLFQRGIIKQKQYDEEILKLNNIRQQDL